VPARLDVVTVEDLSAYVDGQADTDLSDAISDVVKEDDRSAEAISAFMTQNALLHRAFDPILEEPVPERLTALLRGGRAPAEQGADD